MPAIPPRPLAPVPAASRLPFPAQSRLAVLAPALSRPASPAPVTSRAAVPLPAASRPAVPAPSRTVRARTAVPALADPAPAVEWDGGRGLYVAYCQRCTDSFESTRLTRAHAWAEAHRCDPELAALLDSIGGRRAA